MTADDAAVDAVALALAIDDWTGGDETQRWLWDCLDRLEKSGMVRDHMAQARVAVTAIQEAAAA